MKNGTRAVTYYLYMQVVCKNLSHAAAFSSIFFIMRVSHALNVAHIILATLLHRWLLNYFTITTRLCSSHLQRLPLSKNILRRNFFRKLMVKLKIPWSLLFNFTLHVQSVGTIIPTRVGIYFLQKWKEWKESVGNIPTHSTQVNHICGMENKVQEYIFPAKVGGIINIKCRKHSYSSNTKCRKHSCKSESSIERVQETFTYIQWPKYIQQCNQVTPLQNSLLHALGHVPLL